MSTRWMAYLLVLAACTSTTVDDTTESTEPDVETTTTSDLPSSPATPVTTTPETTSTVVDSDDLSIESFPVPPGSRPHDVAPAADGGVWYTAQARGALGWLDPDTGEVTEIPLGADSRPHGVIVDDQGTPWVTDGGLNSIVSVDPATFDVTIYPLPDTSNGANLNTAVFDDDGKLWFTGQSGVYGELDVESGETVVYESPRGSGPYGITHTPQGNTVFASLAGSYIGWILEDGRVSVLEPPTPNQGARRVWADSSGAVWVSEWNSGNVSRYVFESGEWSTWSLPGENPAAYAVFVDDLDTVWLSDFGEDAIVRFDPVSEDFTVYDLPHAGGNVRQLHGRPGEVWGAESASDHLILIRTR